MLAADSRMVTGSRRGAIVCYHYSRGWFPVTDVLIRDVPDDVVTALDAQASRLGLSRSEFLRRRLAQQARGQARPVTTADLAAFAETFADLADPEVMKGAWG